MYQNESIFTDVQLRDFARDGFIRLRSAFSNRTALNCRKVLEESINMNGIDTHDANSWPVKLGLTDIYNADLGEPWSDVFTTRLQQAVDQLCGANTWKPFGCGWWVISFPSGPPESGVSIEGCWHIDGPFFLHCATSPDIGLIAIMYFSEVLPGGGGTAVLAGSHMNIGELICAAGVEGISSQDAITSFMRDSFDESAITELAGGQGDVVFMHPYLVHARSKNKNPCSSEYIRFICTPSIVLKEPLDYTLAYEEMSVVQQVIYDSAADKGALRELSMKARRGVSQSSTLCKRKASETASEVVDDLVVTSSLENILGFSEFKYKHKY